MITIQFMVAMVESYIVVAAGFIFLGFGGSRWTAPYAERYIGLAVSNGVKILVIYLLISVGTNLGNAWVAEAQGASTSASPEMVALDVMAAALMYMMLCWQIPKLFSAVLGGSPALAGGDLIAAGSFPDRRRCRRCRLSGGRRGRARLEARGRLAVSEPPPVLEPDRRSALAAPGTSDRRDREAARCLPHPVRVARDRVLGSATSRQPEPPGSSGSSGANVAPASSETSPPSGAIGQAAGAAGKAQDTLGSVSARMRNLGRRLNSVAAAGPCAAFDSAANGYRSPRIGAGTWDSL